MHNTARRVTSADHYIIHGGCEQIIDVFVERRVTDYYQEKCEMVIEPSTTFKENYPLLMTATVVDINYGAAQKVRILNPLDESISIKQDCTVGQAEPFVSIQTIMDTEDEGEVNNYSCINIYVHSCLRQISIGRKPCSNSKTHVQIMKFTCRLNMGFGRRHWSMRRDVMCFVETKWPTLKKLRCFR